jgi:eukaryotic-like serine/threonine-protein kinase
MIGRTLSHYEILDEISRGGMGVVYRARDLNLGREVALKVLPEELVKDVGRRERLLQEARAAAALEHPHIAVIHAVGEAEGVTFIAMELIRGEKLSDILQRGGLPQKRALDLAAEVAEGLARAHDKGIVHRDLKPANVMVTQDGHAKIIDFGLAKLTEPIGDSTATGTIQTPRTDPGLVMGTVSYMSPEQARGLAIDHRSDIFSFGIMLYEMLAGRPPFQGQSQLDTLHAILTQPLPQLPALPGLPAEASADVQRIIAKCTAKDPDERYQGMKDIVVDLRGVRRRLESASVAAPSSGATAVVAPPAPVPVWERRPVQLATLGAVLAVAALFAMRWTRGGAADEAVPARTGKPSVAVLYFENQTGDKSLDWMRTGLTDMMVTDLSQSSDIEVLGTDRLYQILEDLHRADDKVISADLVQQIAQRAKVDQVLIGSYVKAGDTIRINARLQEASTGKIVTSERVEGAGESSIFTIVDELTRRIRSQMALFMNPASAGQGLLAKPEGQPEVGLDRGVNEITTDSIEAYRYYAEAINLHERFLEAQAVPLLEKAIAIDPTFAMALAKLAVINGNLGQTDKQEEYAKRALDNAEHASPREKYYIEGFYYSLRPETFERAAAAYRQGLALHPEHQASRHNLAFIYQALWRFKESADQGEELIRRGTSNPTTYGNLAEVYLALADPDRALHTAQQFVQQHPDSANGHESVGEMLVASGRLPEAQAEFDKAAILDPRDFQAPLGKEMVALLQERWADAEAINRQLGDAPHSFQRWLGIMNSADISLARGQSSDALAKMDRAARLSGASRVFHVNAHVAHAHLLIDIGKASMAVSELQGVLPDARGRATEISALGALADAQASAGRASDARQTLAALEALLAKLPGGRAQVALDTGRGRVALASGDTAAAIQAFVSVVDRLPARGQVNIPGSHVSVWFALASAYLAAGRDDDAMKWLERITSAGHERVSDYVAYVRGHYLLAQLHEKRGDRARANQLYGRFLDYWRDGDMDRTHVADAQRKLAGS